MGVNTVPASASPSLYSRVAIITTSQTWVHPDGYASPRPIKALPTVAIAANSTVVIDLKQVLTAGQIIAGLASAVTVLFHLSGIEVS